MSVVSADGTAGPCEGFVELPPRIYHGDPNWIPEDPAAVIRAFSAENRWFHGGRARTFAVPGRARAAAFRPAAPIEGRPAAFFGYYETTGDAAAIHAVMTEVIAWARAEGAEILYGPIDFSTYGAYRLRTTGAGDTAFVGDPYNPLRYNDELVAEGFAVAQRYVTVWGSEEVARVSVEYGRAVRANLLAEGYRYQSLTPERWMSLHDELYDVIDQIFSKGFGYTKLTRAEFAAHLGERYARKMDPDASLLVFGPAGDLAGMLLFYPDWGPLVSAGAGAARVPVSELDFARDFPTLAAMGPVAGVMKTAGVAVAHRRKGIGESTALGIERAGSRYGRIYNALMREDNPSRKIARLWDGERWYALYSRELGDSAPSASS